MRLGGLNKSIPIKKMIVLHYPKCSTCIKAIKWLEEQGHSPALRHIVQEAPTVEELRAWQSLSGLPLKKFFNTSGQVYRELGLGTKLAEMTEEEQLSLLASNGKLVKRPLFVLPTTVLVGFKPSDWLAALSE